MFIILLNENFQIIVLSWNILIIIILYYLIENILILLKILLIILIFRHYIQVFKYSILKVKIFEFLNLLVI